MSDFTDPAQFRRTGITIPDDGSRIVETGSRQEWLESSG
jgi:hypothetical protein